MILSHTRVYSNDDFYFLQFFPDRVQEFVGVKNKYSYNLFEREANILNTAENNIMCVMCILFSAVCM